MYSFGVNGSLEIGTGTQHSGTTVSLQKCWMYFLKAFPSGSLKELLFRPKWSSCLLYYHCRPCSRNSLGQMYTFVTYQSQSVYPLINKLIRAKIRSRHCKEHCKWCCWLCMVSLLVESFSSVYCDTNVVVKLCIVSSLVGFIPDLVKAS